MRSESEISLREAAQQALEALSEYEKSYPAVADAFKPLRTALAEDAMQRLTDVQQEMEETSQESRQVEPMAWLIEYYDIYAKRTLQRLVFDNPKNMQGVKITAYYTTPPKREPLSSIEIQQIELKLRQYSDYDKYDLSLHDFARAIERAHGIGGEE